MYSVGIAYILWFVSGCGALGFHRFYLGKISTGVLWMFTGGLLAIGSIYDFFTLPRQVREANFRNAYLNSVRGNDAGNQSWRNADDVEVRIVREKETLEQKILKTAKANNGILTASEVALIANISVDEAKKNLDMLVSKGFAELRVRQSGSIVYTIPDLMGTEEPLVD